MLCARPSVLVGLGRADSPPIIFPEPPRFEAFLTRFLFPSYTHKKKDNRDADTVTVQRFAKLVKKQNGLMSLLQAYATPSPVPHTDASPPVSEPRHPLESLRETLRPVDFGQDLVKHTAAYIQGTREWVFNRLVDWAALPKEHDDYRAFWLTGGAGLGKSVIAAQLIERRHDLSHRIKIAAHFFCKHDDVTRSSPHRAIATLAFLMAANINAVRDTLLATENLSHHLDGTTSIDDTFEVLLAKPLKAWEKTGNADPICILIDALDELDACSPSRMQLLQLVGKKLPTLPAFVRIIVTSRSESDIVASLRSLAPLCIERSSKDQLKDLDYYVEKEILSLSSLHALKTKEKEAVKKMVMERADGVFLAARLIRDALVARDAGHLTLALVNEELQGSDNYIYKTFANTLERVKARLKLADDEGIIASEHATKTLHNILAVLVVVREPLRAIHLAELCGVDQPLSGSLMQALLSAVSLLFTTQGARGVVEPIHKSVFDFLLDAGAGWWQVDVTQGHAVLAQSCWRVLKDSGILARARIVPSEELATNILLTYCLRHGHVHLTHAASSRDVRAVWRRAMLAPETLPLQLREARETATNEFAMWLLLVSHTMGRKRALVPELHRLAKALSPSRNGALNPENGALSPEQDGLCHLFRELSVLYGNKWAPGADLYHSAALLRTECSANGVLAHSPALKTLAVLVGFVPQVLRMPGLSGPGSCLNTLEGHSQHVASVQFSRNGSRILSGGSDGMIRLWDAETGEVLCTLEAPRQDGVRATDLAADGSCIVSGGCDKMVHVWDVATGECRHSLEGHDAEITSIVLSPDENVSIVASGSFDKTIRLWDWSTGELLRTLNGHTDRICSIDFSPDGKRIVSGSHDTTVRVWDVGEAPHRLNAEAPHRLNAEAPHRLNAEAPHRLNAEAPHRLNAEAPHRLNAEAPHRLNAEAPHRLNAEAPHRLNAEAPHRLNAPRLLSAEAPHFLLSANAGGILSVHFSPDGGCVVAGDGSNNVHVWDVGKSEKIHTLIGHTSAVLTVRFNHDGTRIVSGGLDRTLRVWNAESGMLSHVLPGHDIGVCCARFSYNGSRIVSGGQDCVLRVWDAVTAETQHVPGGHDRPIFAVDFSHDGTHIVSGGEDTTVRQWSAETGALIRVLDEGGFL
jgi:WD40 repeat protein